MSGISKKVISAKITRATAESAKSLVRGIGKIASSWRTFIAVDRGDSFKHPIRALRRSWKKVASYSSIVLILLIGGATAIAEFGFPEPGAAYGGKRQDAAEPDGAAGDVVTVRETAAVVAPVEGAAAKPKVGAVSAAPSAPVPTAAVPVAAAAANHGTVLWVMLHEIPAPFEDRPTAVTLAVDGTLAAAGFADGSIAVFGSDRTPGFSMPGLLPGAVVAVAIAPDPARAGEYLVAAGSDAGRVAVVDAESMELRSSCDAHKGAVTAVAFSRDGARLYSAGRDGRVRSFALPGLGDAQSAALGEPAAALARASESGLVVAAGADGALASFSGSALNELGRFSRQAGAGNLALSADGALLAWTVSGSAATDSGRLGAAGTFAMKAHPAAVGGGLKGDGGALNAGVAKGDSAAISAQVFCDVGLACAFSDGRCAVYATGASVASGPVAAKYTHRLPWRAAAVAVQSGLRCATVLLDDGTFVVLGK